MNEFPFFPHLHALLATHPNLNPVAVTTGVGPHGCEVMNFHGSSASSPSATTSSTPDELIDPVLLGIDSPPTPTPPSMPATADTPSQPPSSCYGRPH